ncbi:hypothetical protein SEUCBS139899_001086 [Sporothrix eucalyptigena]|uniref:DUF4097 domain-containing protein n=1 Tax=Sporothrix eucalyptigena TaxID=1812306 RepID=A0ABP0B5S6_9PEZI
MADKQPLLYVDQRGESQPHIDSCDFTPLHDASQDIYRAAAEARLRRRRAARRAHFLGFVLLLTIGYWTHGFGLPALSAKLFHWRNGGDAINIGSTPLEGPLILPDSPQCLLHHGDGDLHTYPLASYPLHFGSDHSLTVLQNTTRHWAPPYDPPRNDDHDHRWRHVHVSGEVVVRQATDDHKPSVEVEALSNDKRIRTAYTFAKDSQKLSVIVDDRIWVEREHWHDGDGACLVVRVTVWVPAAHLREFHVAAVHLGVQLIDDLDLVVDEAARLRSVIGSIVSSRGLEAEAVPQKNCHGVEMFEFASGYRFEAAETDVATTSSNIRGPWSLLDRLHIFSVSGSISVAVRPEGLEKDNKDLADLRLETVSGSIGFEEIKKDDDDDTIARAHRLSLASRSGVVHGSGSFAQLARLDTTSGNIAVALTPYKVESDENANLDTSTVSGKTVVFLLNEVHDAPVDYLESTHHAVSGAIELHYPASWVGDIHVETLTGSVGVEGKGVHVVPDDSPRWPPKVGRKVDAIKERVGDDDGKDDGRRSSLKADTISGHVKLTFPE